MHLSEEEIKIKLIEASQQQFRKTRKKQRVYQKLPHSSFQYSQWSTQKDSQQFGFPILQKVKQSSKQLMNSTSFKLGFQKKRQQKNENFLSHLPNPVNINFHSQNIKNSRRSKYKNLKDDINLQRNFSHQICDQKGNKLSQYLLNKEVKVIPHQLIKSQRSSNLLKLLKQRDLLRRKRYSFDIQCGFSTRTASFY